MASGIKVVPTTKKLCKPFVLEVMVFSPESGFKFKVIVERSCTPKAEPLWKLVFDLFEIETEDGEITETQLVHVSFTTSTPVEAQAVQLMAAEGVKPAQAKILINEVHPAAKAVSGAKKPTEAQKKALKKSMQKVVSVDV
jgi:hypothetical protein